MEIRQLGPQCMFTPLHPAGESMFWRPEDTNTPPTRPQPQRKLCDTGAWAEAGDVDADVGCNHFQRRIQRRRRAQGDISDAGYELRRQSRAITAIPGSRRAIVLAGNGDGGCGAALGHGGNSQVFWAWAP